MKPVVHLGLTAVYMTLASAAGAATTQIFLADVMAQYYITPYATTYDFTIAGGGGGDYYFGSQLVNTGGAGAITDASIYEPAGVEITLLVGQRGHDGNYGFGAGGGAGTAILQGSSILLIAGGGGGAGHDTGGLAANTGTAGSTQGNGQPGAGGAGGGAGNSTYDVATASEDGGAGGGAGDYGRGQSSSDSYGGGGGVGSSGGVDTSIFGPNYLLLGAGGSGGIGGGSGSGGGGDSSQTDGGGAGGGGGGYSGGAGGDATEPYQFPSFYRGGLGGGGGGSLNNWPSTLGIVTTNLGDGFAAISYDYTPPPPPPSPPPPPPPPSPVPEPATWALMTIGLAGLGAALRRRRSPGHGGVAQPC